MRRIAFIFVGNISKIAAMLLWIITIYNLTFVAVTTDNGCDLLLNSIFFAEILITMLYPLWFWRCGFKTDLSLFIDYKLQIQIFKKEILKTFNSF